MLVIGGKDEFHANKIMDKITNQKCVAGKPTICF
jgi:hypothetical protein